MDIHSLFDKVKEHIKDGGWKSRKLLLVAYTQLLIVSAAALTKWIPSISGVYSAMIGGLIGALTLYVGGNVTAKHVLGKSADALSKNVTSASSEQSGEPQ
jgi:F0F1-type ATP synthase assembly protein I